MLNDLKCLKKKQNLDLSHLLCSLFFWYVKTLLTVVLMLVFFFFFSTTEFNLALSFTLDRDFTPDLNDATSEGFLELESDVNSAVSTLFFKH